MTDAPVVLAAPISAEAFAAYGDVLAPPAEVGRTYFDGGLTNARASAPASLSISLIPATAALRITFWCSRRSTPHRSPRLSTSASR